MARWPVRAPHAQVLALAVVAVITAVSALVEAARPIRVDVEILKPQSALPPHVLAQMDAPLAVARTDSGDYLVLDRRGHAVFRVDPAGRNVRRLMGVGIEGGRLLRPSAMVLADNGIFAVLDTPTAYQRIQYFDTSGMLVGIFYLPLRGTANLVVGDDVVTGAGAMAFTGRTFLVNQPAWGSLIAELDNSGAVLGHIGQFRPTGHEADRDLHLAFNTGLPVVDPTGGSFFVFQTGVPLFRKFDRDGRLVFERHIEGVELDAAIQTLPNRWLQRPDGAKPFPVPVVHTAAADRQGRLWVAVRTGYTYVYDQQGEKIRTIRFDGAKPIYPTSFYFTANGRLIVGPEGYEFLVNR